MLPRTLNTLETFVCFLRLKPLMIDFVSLLFHSWNTYSLHVLNFYHNLPLKWEVFCLSYMVMFVMFKGKQMTFIIFFCGIEDMNGVSI